MDNVKKKYTNGEITVFWEPDLCNHSAICFRMLPKVFKPAYRPWIEIDGATTEEIIKTVKLCPTKALYYKLSKEEPMESNKLSEKTIITLLQDGPLLLNGNFEMLDNEGNVLICDENIALCRCGASKRKPFCDGSHTDINFKD